MVISFFTMKCQYFCRERGLTIFEASSTFVGNPFSEPESIERKTWYIKENQETLVGSWFLKLSSKIFTSKITWACQCSESCSSETHKLGSSSGTVGEGLRIHEIRSSFISASSCQRDDFLKRQLNSVHLVAFLQRCSKFFRIS